MSSTTTIAVGVSLAVFSFILIGVLLFFVIRRNRSPHPDKEASFSTAGHKRVGSVVLDKSHPAAKAVTPFAGVAGLGGEVGPRFNHTPGEDMRVAHRRSDGGWSFSGSLALNTVTNNPRLPPGLTLHNSNLTSPSTHHLLSPSTDSLSPVPHRSALSPLDARTNYSPTSTIFTITPASRTSEKEKKMAAGELTTRGFVELDLDGDMPPAYSYKIGDDEDDEDMSSEGHGGRHDVHQ